MSSRPARTSPSRAPATAAVLAIAAGLLGAACGARTSTAGTGGGAAGTTGAATSAASTSGTGGGGPCHATSTSNLPGVLLQFAGSGCTYTLAQAKAGIAIPYSLLVAADEAGVTPQPQDAGHCGRPGPTPLTVFETLGGNGQGYCMCDVGLCPSNPTPVTLRAGSYPAAFKWDGRNWGGPSDTVNPEGAPFPPGTYTLEVSAVGQVVAGNGAAPFKVDATYRVYLVP